MNTHTVARLIVPVAGLVSGVLVLAAALCSKQLGDVGAVALAGFAATLSVRATKIAKALDPTLTDEA